MASAFGSGYQVPYDCNGSRAAAGLRVKRSSDACSLNRPTSSECRERGLVGCTVVDDLEWRLGQPERLRQQSAVGKVTQPDFELERQVVERSQDATVGCLSNCPALHRTSLCDHIVCWDADGGERRLQGFAEPPDEGTALLRRHHYGQQTSIADTEHHLNPANADQTGVPVAEDSVRPRRLRIELRVEPVEQFLGTPKDKHSGGTWWGRHRVSGLANVTFWR